MKHLLVALATALGGSFALLPDFANALPTCTQLLTMMPIAGNPAVYVSASRPDRQGCRSASGGLVAP